MVAMLSIKFNTRCYISYPTNAQFCVLNVHSLEKDVCYMITATATKHQLQSNQIGAQQISLCAMRCSLGTPKLLQDFTTVAVNITHPFDCNYGSDRVQDNDSNANRIKRTTIGTICQLFNRAVGNKFYFNPLELQLNPTTRRLSLLLHESEAEPRMSVITMITYECSGM